MKFSNPHLIWQMDDLGFYFKPVSCCFTPWLVGLCSICGVLKSHKSRRISVAGQPKCLISPLCHSQQSHWSSPAALLLNLQAVPHWCGREWVEGDVGKLTHSTWCATEKCATSFPLRNPSPQFLPRWGLAFSHSHVCSCKKTVPSQSCAQKIIFLSLIVWAALIGSPVGSLLHNIQLICSPTASWKWLGRFLFCFVPSPFHPTDHIQEKYLVSAKYPWPAGDFS